MKVYYFLLSHAQFYAYSVEAYNKKEAKAKVKDIFGSYPVSIWL